MRNPEKLFREALREGMEQEYFADLYEAEQMETEGSPERTMEKWDKRADAWEAERREGRREARDERLLSTVEYLKSRGLLTPEQTVADIGCGPGRFAAEFGKTAGHVTGFDFSEKMIGYGKDCLVWPLHGGRPPEKPKAADRHAGTGRARDGRPASKGGTGRPPKRDARQTSKPQKPAGQRGRKPGKR